jgi:hypothetical protein
MGPVGATIGTSLGHMAGTYLGKKLGDDYKGQTAVIGATLGGLAGGLIPAFKNGGKIPGVKGKPKIILAHSGEFILPVGVPPTNRQQSAIEKKKKIKKEKIHNYFV